MHKVIFDCDNTMGVEGRDVDDGFALLYLLGRDDVDLLGVTTTFGNSTIDVVHHATMQLFIDAHVQGISLIRGGASSEQRQSEASQFLAERVKKQPGEITILATGSLSNVFGAFQEDETFFENVKQIVLMGGITEPLIINGRRLDELNFASDPEAAYHVLHSKANVTSLTGNLCLQAYFGQSEYERLSGQESSPSFQYIRQQSLPWLSHVKNKFEMDGYYVWDVVAAVYITHPELFEENVQHLVSTQDDLKHGILKTGQSNAGNVINLPTKIKDKAQFTHVIFEAWRNITME